MRLADADNCHVARANAPKDNVTLCRVVRGRRQQITGASAKASSGERHTLGLRAEGDQLSVRFDAKPLLTANDQTFSGSGRVALWTKADSATRFDRLKIQPLQYVAAPRTQEMHMVKTALKAAALLLSLPAAAVAAGNDWGKVADALGRSGTEMPGGVYRVGLPRTDLHVTLDGVQIKPTLALGSWLAFQESGGMTMVMGDLVLTEDEVGPVMKKLAEGGLEITALHNHLLRAQPSTLYMHVLGHGDPVKLATALHDGLALSETPLSAATASVSPQAPAAGSDQPPRLDLDAAMIDQVLGAKGKAVGGVYQVGIPRAEVIHDGGMEVPVAMGSAEAINFQPTGGGKAAITGDFVLTAGEVNPVLRALRENGIEVTAVHNHMLDDQPRLFFMHFWANDDAAKLAKGLRAALDKVNVARS